jgi:putative SOS response-associated peptidase YedK
MCGRYTLKTDAKVIQDELGLEETPALTARYNIAPTQGAPIVTAMAPRALTVAQWGLIPHWATDPRIGARHINARSEGLDEKKAFKEAFSRRRCLVLADGFYEWTHAGKVSQPFYIHQASDRPFTLAGLWELWHSPAGLDVVSFTIVTTSADPFMSKLHDRMPVFLDRAARAVWLAPDSTPAALKALMHPGSPEPLEAFEVEPRVNSAAVDDVRCLEPARQVQLSLL